jgi:hypothetical protein
MTASSPDLTPLDEPPDAPPEEMRRRERAWLATRRPTALWPGLDALVIQSSADAIGDVVAAVLRGKHPALDVPSVRASSDAGTTARALGVAALLTGVGPLLGAWLEGGILTADEPVALVLARHLAHCRARGARIRAEVIPVLRRMEAAGLEPGVLKGFHTAHAYFPEAGARPFADVDVLVAPEHVGRAEEILRDAGFSAGPVQAGAYKRDWTPAGEPEAAWSHELWHARSPWRIELHDGMNFLPVTDTVAAPQTVRLSETMAVDGVVLRVAAPGALVALLATHAASELYSHRLLRLTELAMVIRREREQGRLDWREVQESLARVGTLHFAYPSFTLVERLAPGTVDAPVLERVRGATTRRIREVTERFTPTAPILEGRLSLDERLLWTRGIGATLRRLGQMLVPPRHGTPRDRLRVLHDRAVRLFTAGVGMRVERRPDDRAP